MRKPGLKLECMRKLLGNQNYRWSGNLIYVQKSKLFNRMKDSEEIK